MELTNIILITKIEDDEIQICDLGFIPPVGTTISYEFVKRALQEGVYSEESIELWSKLHGTEFIVTNLKLELRNYNGKHSQIVWVYVEQTKGEPVKWN